MFHEQVKCPMFDMIVGTGKEVDTNPEEIQPVTTVGTAPAVPEETTLPTEPSAVSIAPAALNQGEIGTLPLHAPHQDLDRQAGPERRDANV
jgi:hypothetical protein